MVDGMDTVTVSIFGESYTVKAGPDPDYITEVARFVDGKMRDIAAGGKIVTTSKIAILAALNIADELMSDRRDRETREAEQAAKIEKLVAVLKKAVED